MKRVTTWGVGEYPNMVTEKTKIVLLLTRQRIQNEIEMRVRTDVIATRNPVKYLGLHLDSKLT